VIDIVADFIGAKRMTAEVILLVESMEVFDEAAILAARILAPGELA
jgi:hypothetical protein